MTRTKIIRFLQSSLGLIVALFLGLLHASYWNIPIVGLALTLLAMQLDSARWRAMLKGAGWRQAAPALIILFAAQTVYAALAYAIGFSIGVGQGDRPTAPTPVWSDIHVIATAFGLGLVLGLLEKKLAQNA
jgi:hypothetical protein